ncbi:MAG: RNase adapter RapZ [Nitrospirota bacterium]
MKPTIVIISGLAGSGKTVALRALEDQGFYCVDNLPVTFIKPFASIITSADHKRKVGIGVDIREKEFLPSVKAVLNALRKKYNVEIIFLEADRDALIRRFKETRRPHPLTSTGIHLDEAITKEKDLLSPLREEADKILDTTAYTPHQLRHTISSFYKPQGQDSTMVITVISFGFKYGIPQNIDLLFDVRFIPNPHFVPELRELTGTDNAVKDFVLKPAATQEFMDKTADLLNFLIPHYVNEGKAYLTVGFGCTGGKHRSPAIAEAIAKAIKMRHNVDTDIIHRDIGL